MTAMVTGVKTRSGVLGVDDPSRDRRLHRAATRPRCPTLLERAERRGLCDRRRHHHHGHARDARRLLRAHAGARLGERREAVARRARRRLPRHRAPARRVPRTATGSRSRSAAAARSSCRRRGGSRAPERRGERLDGRDLTAEWQKRVPRAAPYVWNARRSFVALDPAKSRRTCSACSSRATWSSRRSARPNARGEPSLAEMTAQGDRHPEPRARRASC